jgi:hypothetical protein
VSAVSDYRVLDLFAGLGGFSSAFEESERWRVTTVDIAERFDPDIQADVFELRPSDFSGRAFDVVLAGVSCQFLSTCGNHEKWDHEEKEPAAPESRGAVALFYHTLGLIRALNPKYWYVENPRRSRIRWFIGLPDEWVSYCQYGMDYQKQTGFWGEFAPMTFEQCSGEGSCHNNNSAHDGYSAVQSMPSDTAERAKVPDELSAAIRDACEAALDGEVAEQATFAEVMA